MVSKTILTFLSHGGCEDNKGKSSGFRPIFGLEASHYLKVEESCLVLELKLLFNMGAHTCTQRSLNSASLLFAAFHPTGEKQTRSSLNRKGFFIYLPIFLCVEKV